MLKRNVGRGLSKEVELSKKVKQKILSIPSIYERALLSPLMWNLTAKVIHLRDICTDDCPHTENYS